MDAILVQSFQFTNKETEAAECFPFKFFILISMCSLNRVFGLGWGECTDIFSLQKPLLPGMDMCIWASLETEAGVGGGWRLRCPGAREQGWLLSPPKQLGKLCNQTAVASVLRQLG